MYRDTHTRARDAIVVVVVVVVAAVVARGRGRRAIIDRRRPPGRSMPSPFWCSFRRRHDVRVLSLRTVTALLLILHQLLQLLLLLRHGWTGRTPRSSKICRSLGCYLQNLVRGVDVMFLQYCHYVLFRFETMSFRPAPTGMMNSASAEHTPRAHSRTRRTLRSVRIMSLKYDTIFVSLLLLKY